MKTLLIIALILSINVKAQTMTSNKLQTTIPVKGRFAKKISTYHYWRETGLHADLYFDAEGGIWVNKYKGKYYSNWPYKVVFNKHLVNIFDVRTNHVIYVYIIPIEKIRSKNKGA